MNTVGKSDCNDTYPDIHVERSPIDSLINKLVLSLRGKQRFQCPFCLFDFAFDFLLQDHVRENHLNEIENYDWYNLESIPSDTCLYCHAKFYVKKLLPRHVIRKHDDYIVHHISKLKSDNIYCKFCTYKTLRTQTKLLFIHFENKHLKLFEKLLTDVSVEFNNALQQSVNENDKLSLLNSCMKKLALSDNHSNKSKSNVSRDRKFSFRFILKRPNNPTLCSLVRRQLHFDSPNTSGKCNGKENYEVCKRSHVPSTIESELITITPDKLNPDNQPVINHSTPVYLKNIKIEKGISVLDNLPYRCCLCIENFSNNDMLVKHVKRIHRGFKFKACYGCGKCKAKFYKNSYLIRHQFLHS